MLKLVDEMPLLVYPVIKESVLFRKTKKADTKK